MTLLTVSTTPVCSHDLLHSDDLNYPELTDIHIENSVPGHLLADAALDVFHANTPIKRLEDFTFDVYHGDKLLMPYAEHDAGSLSERGEIVCYHYCALKPNGVQ